MTQFLQTPYGYKLAITEDIIPDADTTALMLHGFDSNRSSRRVKAGVETFRKHHISTCCPDFYGRGESDGEFGDLTVTRGVDNVITCVDHVLSRDPRQKIILSGGSYGGLIALHAAAQLKDKITLLILRSAVSEWKECWKKELTDDVVRAWKETGFFEGALPHGKIVRFGMETYHDLFDDDVYGRIAPQITAPALIVHGTADETVPFAQSVKLHQAIPGSVFIPVEGADHRFSNPDHMGLYQSAIENFLNQGQK